jgi:hypothetical protein
LVVSEWVELLALLVVMLVAAAVLSFGRRNGHVKPGRRAASRSTARDSQKR